MAGVPLDSFRVCVADDNVESAAVLAEGLMTYGYETVMAYTGGEVLEACGHGGVDLVLLDVLLPDIDGYEVCRCLKADPKTRDIVVFFVTVKGSLEDVAKGYELGAADYLSKPYNLPMVIVRVECALRDKQSAEQLRPAAPPFTDSSYTDTLTGLRNRRFLLERLQEEVDKAHRYSFPVSCVALDVDEVHALDEELGPVSMDDLLVEIGMILRNHSRTYDVIARYDGTLFAAVLPHSPLNDAIGYATKIMREIESTTFSDPNFPTQAKLSVGIVSCQNGSAMGAEHVLGEAMRGLLQARSLTSARLVARNLNEA